LARICIFSRAFYPAIGGLERIAHILAAEAARIGHDVEVVTDTPGNSVEDDCRFLFKITRTREHPTRAMAFQRADVVLFMNVTLHGMRAALAARVPIVFSHHGIYRGKGLVGRSLEFIKRQLTRFYPNISVSQFVAHGIPAKSIIVANAYDNTLFKQPVARLRERDFVFCGRLVSDKGADVCINAFFLVLKSMPDATLTLVGDGPERQKLERTAQQLGISDQIEFTGALSGLELAKVLQSHACMVVPSLVEEGFGITVLEGIACCDTAIVARRGGLPEAAGNCGLVVYPSVGQIGDAMISVVHARRKGLPLPGQPCDEVRMSHLARHTPETVTKKYLDVIEQAISNRATSGRG